MAFRKVWFLMWQLIGLGLAQSNIPVAPVQAKEFEAPRQYELCPPHYQKYNNSCYRVFSTRKTWAGAEAECRTENPPTGQGHLVSILSNDENCFVKGLWLKTNPPKRGCYSTAWIGLSDTDEGGNSGFIWSDGNGASYKNWANNQPNTNGNKYCASFKRGGDWTTASCERKKRFICKV